MTRVTRTTAVTQMSRSDQARGQEDRAGRPGTEFDISGHLVLDVQSLGTPSR